MRIARLHLLAARQAACGGTTSPLTPGSQTEGAEVHGASIDYTDQPVSTRFCLHRVLVPLSWLFTVSLPLWGNNDSYSVTTCLFLTPFLG